MAAAQQNNATVAAIADSNLGCELRRRAKAAARGTITPKSESRARGSNINASYQLATGPRRLNFWRLRT
jgi:hypothetical protein